MTDYVDFDPDRHEAVLRALLTDYLEELAPALKRELDVVEDLPAVVDDDMQHLDQFSPPAGRLLMVVEDEKVVGTGSLRRSVPGVAEVKRMYLIPAARGRGLGRELLDELVDTARHDGYREVRLDTHPDIMPLAIGFYRAAGFEPCDPYPESEVPAEWHDRWVFMRRTLNDLEQDTRQPG